MLSRVAERLHVQRRLRLEQERWYRERLAGIAGLFLPATSTEALSHFTIRVAPDRREAVRRALWQAGVDSGALFGVPDFLDPDAYPVARATARRQVNLPMGRRVTRSTVERIGIVLSSFRDASLVPTLA
jgi:dTDP-4-amino-4,6-dideoxygalactose transaminase